MPTMISASAGIKAKVTKKIPIMVSTFTMRFAPRVENISRTLSVSVSVRDISSPTGCLSK
ncbi:MAG: hypothetical protein BWX45_00535 [Deltaproteobacteria bacterium ADurb.Bin002]|nr:MAG: hypothetical protein BWX45_00535 [Deltaproteobacteria bacterium ADurb.Bin002]